MPSKYIVTTDLCRREFISRTAAVTLGAGLLGCNKSGTRKPNLLFLWTDEQRADTMAAYGNHQIKTPNLNKLASESVVFENAYVSQPVCTPSRSTVMTGLWPHTNGCTENNTPLALETKTFPELLNDSDYRTGYFGKWHLGDEIFDQHGFEEWVSIEDGYRKYYRDVRDRSQKSSYHHFLKELGYEPDTSDGDFSRGFAASLPIEHCKPAFLAREACDFIRRHQKEPFVLYINFLEPHMPFTGPLNDLHHPDEIDLPQNFDDPLEDDEPLRYRLLREHYYQNGHRDHELRTEKGWRRLIANYWGLVSQVDRSVGRILEKLEELGLAENTIVVYTSDHGDMMGSHRLLAKTVMYEESVRVPLLMRIPKFGFRQRLVPERVSHIDLVPTLLELMGKRIPNHLQGHSLKSIFDGGSPIKEHVFIEWNPAIKRGRLRHSIPSVTKEQVERVHRSHVSTVISPNGWKLCLSDNDKSQLFNLNEDPWETANLFYTGAHEDVIKRLMAKLYSWQESTGDVTTIK